MDGRLRVIWGQSQLRDGSWDPRRGDCRVMGWLGTLRVPGRDCDLGTAYFFHPRAVASVIGAMETGEV